MTSPNRAASVRARLLNKARADGVDFQLLLTRYGLERLLYRLSVSRERDNFLLKGALLFDLWFDVPLRPTRDIDLLGFGLAEIPLLVAAFEGMCAIEVDDGMVFDAASIRADEIRKEANYAGIRLTLTGMIDGARCPVQVDVGYGDAVTPAVSAFARITWQACPLICPKNMLYFGQIGSCADTPCHVLPHPIALIHKLHA